MSKNPSSEARDFWLKNLYPALNFMYYVYCLQNGKNGKFYYGYSQDLRRRMKEHKISDNNWELVYYESYRSKIDAAKRERKLKQYGQARSRLKQRIVNSLL